VGWTYGGQIIGHVRGVVRADVGVVRAHVGHGAGGEEEDESELGLAELRRPAHLHVGYECC
jgi:hypothetical protein